MMKKKMSRKRNSKVNNEANRKRNSKADNSGNIRVKAGLDRKTPEGKLYEYCKRILLCGIGAFIMYCGIFWSEIQNGFWLVCNQILEKIGSWKGRIFTLYEADEKGSVWWIIVLLLWFVLLLAGCLIQRSKKSWNYICRKILLVLLAAAMWVGIWNIPGINRMQTCLEKGLQMTEKTVDTVRYGTNEAAGLCDGQLDKAVQKKASEDVMLEVVMSQPESIYLKGYVGEIYEDSSWYAIDNRKLYEEWELFYWLHHRGFYGQTQLADVAQTYGEQTENIINIHNIAADRRYIYIPYEMAACANLQENMIGDQYVRANGILGQDTYQMTAYAGIRCAYPDFLNAGKADSIQQQTSGTEGNGVDTNNENHYRRWVYKQYLQVPEQFQKLFQSVLGVGRQKSADGMGNGSVSVAKAKEQVLDYLQNTFTYEENPGEVPETEDALLWFMQKSGKGYDVQYASAATLMFRYLGIPARYAEGYIITRQQAESGGRSRVMEIDGSAGHAWTEIYVDTIGWIPFEVTPAYRDRIEEAEDYHVPEISESQEGSSDNLSEPGNQLPDEKEDAGNQKKNGKTLANEIKDNTKLEKNTMIFLWGIGMIVLIVLIILFVYIFAKISKKRKIYRKKMENPDRAEACQFLFAQCMNALEKKQFRWRGHSLEENAGELERMFGREYVDNFAQMWKFHERIRFAGDKVSEDRYNGMVDFYRKTKGLKIQKQISKKMFEISKIR